MSKDLLELAGLAENKGCLTCGRYSPMDNGEGFVDDDYNDEGRKLEDKNDSPAYWCWCELNLEGDTAIRINCGDWEE